MTEAERNVDEAAGQMMRLLLTVLSNEVTND